MSPSQVDNAGRRGRRQPSLPCRLRGVFSCGPCRDRADHQGALASGLPDKTPARAILIGTRLDQDFGHATEEPVASSAGRHLGDLRADPAGQGMVRQRSPAVCQPGVPSALLYVLASGIGWEFLPWCFPSYKTVQRRLKDWLRDDAFLRAWGQLAQRYERLHGINWDQLLLDGSKKPSEKGARRRGRVRSIAASRAPRSTSPRTRGPRRWPSWSPRPVPTTGARPTRYSRPWSSGRRPRRCRPTPPTSGADQPPARTGRTGTGRHETGPARKGSGCTLRAVVRSALGSVKYATRSSGVTTSSPRSVASAGDATGTRATTSAGAKWPRV